MIVFHLSFLTQQFELRCSKKLQLNMFSVPLRVEAAKETRDWWNRRGDNCRIQEVGGRRGEGMIGFRCLPPRSSHAAI
ncbi:hypothetical protein CEXT_97821 [Caerostris extrusa]|uniref:Uncharacterized protein n=1 Tax=Caerostris extrusa TaxID=172846 RepID=A0AAV4XJQ8_CAEEX|nr:hypothetical protein CEXT_97821 [Caerostris extrusa]